MRSYAQLRNGSNPIETISYFPKDNLLCIIYHLTFLTFLVNFSNQLFGLIYKINHFIKSAAPWAYGTSFFLINVRT